MNAEEVVLELILNIVYCDRILIMICTCPSYIKGAEKMKFDKAEISGLLVLFIGVGLLAFTFLNAYWLLTADVGIVATQDLIAAFGKAVAPLMATVIHVMYLGIMGWIGSLLTLRGISLLVHPKPMVAQPTPIPEQPATTRVVERQPPAKVPEQQPAAKPEAKPKEEPREEPEKKPETGITIEVRPPQETKETPQKPAQPQQPNRQSEQ
jgi:hypothetical protein